MKAGRFSALLLLPLLAACGGDGLSPREIVGHWHFAAESGTVEWRRDEVRLILDENGGLIRVHATFADDGRPEDHLRAYTRVEGGYEVRGDSLIVEIARVEHWRHAQPPRDPEVQNPVVYAEERYRVRLIGDRLLLEETRLVDGQPVTYHHGYRRADQPRQPWDGPGR